MGAEILAWRRAVAQHWHEARFGRLEVATRDGRYHFTVEVYLGGLDPDAVRVELYADAIDGEGPACLPLTRGRRLDAPGNGYAYETLVEASRNADDYTVRLVPYHRGAAVPLEAAEILWQR